MTFNSLYIYYIGVKINTLFYLNSNEVHAYFNYFINILSNHCKLIFDFARQSRIYYFFKLIYYFMFYDMKVI